MKLACLVLVTVLAAAGLTACGESKEDKAMTSVCDARSDIQKQVDHLKNLPIAPSSISEAQTTIKAIGDDLTKIKNAQGDLKGDRKEQIEAANKAFKTQLDGIVSNVTSNLSLTNAGTQLKSAFQQLSAAYKQNLGPIDCS